MTSHENITGEAIAFLQEQFTRFCRLNNAQGSLTEYSLENFEITEGDLTELLHENDVTARGAGGGGGGGGAPAPPPPPRIEGSFGGVTVYKFCVFHSGIDQNLDLMLMCCAVI